MFKRFGLSYVHHQQKLKSESAKSIKMVLTNLIMYKIIKKCENE